MAERAYEEVVEILSIRHLIKYPLGTIRYDYSRKFGIDIPMLGGLSPGQVDRIEQAIGDDEFGILTEIAGQDEHVKNLMAEIESLPDKTDAEREAQIVEFDKTHIEHMGVDQWLALQEHLMEHSSNPDEVARMKERTEKLVQWARSQGFDKPRHER